MFIAQQTEQMKVHTKIHKILKSRILFLGHFIHPILNVNVELVIVEINREVCCWLCWSALWLAPCNWHATSFCHAWWLLCDILAPASWLAQSWRGIFVPRSAQAIFWITKRWKLWIMKRSHQDNRAKVFLPLSCRAKMDGLHNHSLWRCQLKMPHA